MFTSPVQCRGAFLTACLLAAPCGCSEPNVYQPPPPPSVNVALPVRRDVTEYLEESGTTEAVQYVEVRSRVEGFLESIQFEPNDEVHEGDLLFMIEQRKFIAQVELAKAELSARMVEREKGEVEYQRQQNLFRENATAETNVVTAKAAWDAAIAAVEGAKARLDEAQLQLDYTEVRAPIDGRVGKALVKRGNLVSGQPPTHLTTIVQYDPIYANFYLSERAFLELLDETRSEHSEKQRREIPLYLARANDEGFPYEGSFDYADLVVDQSTGTIAIRGLFPNPELRIAPGLFVRIRIPINVRSNALLVPERATGFDQVGRYLLVVNEDNVVERRDVVVETKLGDLVVIEQGLEPDERVVVDGMLRSRPGAMVEPNEVAIGADEAALESVGQRTTPEESAADAGPTPSDVGVGPPAPGDGTPVESAR